MAKITYPPARRCEHVDTYDSLSNGTVQVADPYRWLEDSENSETAAFADSQNNAFHTYIKECPHRDQIRQAVADVTAVPQLGCPHVAGDFYYQNHREKTPQPITYRKPRNESSFSSELGEVFMDANRFSEKGTSAVQTCAFSRNATYFAYAVSEGGSDWLTIYVKPLKPNDSLAAISEPAFADGVRLADKVEDVKWSAIHWNQDETGFYYQRFPKTQNAAEADRDSALYFHKVGTSQSVDIFVYQDEENPFKQYFPSVSDDGAWLVITETYQGTLTKDVIIMSTKSQTVKNRVRLGDGGTTNPIFVGNVDTRFYFSTTWDATRGRLMAYDMATNSWSEHIAEDETAILRAAYAYSERYLLVVYTQDVKDELWVFDLASGRRLQQIGKDIVGSVQIKQTLGRRLNQQLFLKFSSYLAPDSIYAVRSDSIRLHSQSLIPGLDTSKYVTRQEFFQSKDGTSIPMFLTHKKNVANGSPVLLYGYGGFNVSVTPNYNPAFMSFLRVFGGTVVCVNLRGGGEYGEEWHRAGMLDKKQNVFDDFHSAAKHLIQTGYTTPDRIIAQGGSNGGLLVAACVNQRPDLYGCVVAKVAVLDCLRYTTSAAGSLGISEIGDPKEPAAFDYLRAYSPLHNVDEEKAYPPILLMTADRDDRVPPMHSLKHVATLQHVKGEGLQPALLRLDKQSGHGQGKSVVKLVDELSDQWAFVALSTGLSVKWIMTWC